MTPTTVSACDQQHQLTIRAELVLPVEPTSAIIEAGARALNELPHAKQEIWCRWMQVAAAVAAIRVEAMHQAGTNRPSGHRYRRAYGAIVAHHGFDRLSKSVRSHLIDCLKHREAIEEWLTGLPPERRLKLTYPVTILRNWRAATPVPNAAKRPSTLGALRERVRELEQLLSRLRNSDGGTLTGKDTARDAVQLLRSIFSESKLIEIRRLLSKAGAR